MSIFYSVYEFLHHGSAAKRWDAFHSPFLFDLFSFACDDTIRNDHFRIIESERRTYLNSKEIIPSVDYGAGSRMIENGKNIKISAVAASALSFPWQCRFMARLAQKLNALSILELGSSLGISAAYLASAVPSARVITVEGNPSVAGKATALFSKLDLDNIQIICEPFEKFLTQNTLQHKPDLIFLDGHHQSEPLIRYYSLLKHMLHDDTVMIIDDIHWSSDMYKGWKTLISFPEVTQSVDCFQFGLLFFRKDFFSKEHHQIRLPLSSLRKT